MDPDKRNAWLRNLDKLFPHQVVLPRRKLSDDSKIMDFLHMTGNRLVDPAVIAPAEMVSQSCSVPGNEFGESP